MKVYHYHRKHILNGLNTNLMPRSLQNVLTNFSILRCVVMANRPMYKILKYKQLCSPRLKSRVGLGPRILSLQVYYRESFISFHVQAVVPVILVKPIDTSPLASVNISPPTNLPTSYKSTWEVLKIVASLVQKIVIRDSASTGFHLKIKEAMHILCRIRQNYFPFWLLLSKGGRSRQL